MQRVLEVEELLSSILQYLPSGSLKAVALTCRRFFLPAARLLWRDTKHGLERLPCLIPQHFDDNNPCTSESFDRFRLYAVFIRTLNITVIHPTVGRHDTGPAPLAFWTNTATEHQMQGHRTDPLLPQLQTLMGHLVDEQYVKALNFFLCPSLKTLDLRLPPHSRILLDDDVKNAIRVFLRDVVVCSPSLLSLAMHCTGCPLVLRRPIGDTISMLGQLRTLKCPSSFAFDDDGLATLSRHPTLMELALIFDPPLDNRLRHLESPILNVIRIKLERMRSSTAKEFLDVVRLPNLRELELVEIRHSAEDYDELINSCSKFKGLTSFTFAKPSFDYPATRSPVSLESLFPLARCSEMQKFVVDWTGCCGPLDARDSHFSVFARSWPLLRQFDLHVTEEEDSRWRSCVLVEYKALTVCGVVWFAIHCADLRLLRLPALYHPEPPMPIDTPMHDARFNLMVSRISGNRGDGLRFLECVLPNVLLTEEFAPYQ